MSIQTSHNPSGFCILILLLIISGAAVLLISPVSADPPFVTIVARGGQSFYLGEEVVFSGVNNDSNSTYLFITGPNHYSIHKIYLKYQNTYQRKENSFSNYASQGYD